MIFIYEISLKKYKPEMKRRLTEEEILYLEIDKEENLDYNYNNKIRIY